MNRHRGSRAMSEIIGKPPPHHAIEGFCAADSVARLNRNQDVMRVDHCARRPSDRCAIRLALAKSAKRVNILYSGYGIHMELKPQDLLVLLKRAANPNQSWTYASMGQALGLSASQVYRSVQRVTEARLAVIKGRGDWDVVPEALVEFAIHGVRYAEPVAAENER
jgi:hypothetical protein